MSDLVNINDLPEVWLPEVWLPDNVPEIFFNVEGWLNECNYPYVKKIEDGYTIYEIPCPSRPEEKDGGAWIRQNDDGNIFAGCNHNKCEKKHWKQIRVAIDPNFENKANDGLSTNVNDPERLARRLLDKCPNTFVLYKESVCEYREGVYFIRKPEFIKRQIRLTIMEDFNAYGHQLKQRGLDTKPPSISESLVNSVYGVLTSIIPEIDSTLSMPCYLNGQRADNVLVVENGILNLDDLSIVPHTHDLFTVFKLPYKFDADATCPTWQTFLKSVWPDDLDTIQLLQEIFGYALTPENWLQVLFLLQGATQEEKASLFTLPVRW